MAIDFGPQGGGSQGPYLNWHAREANDGSVGGRKFSIRDKDLPRAEVTLSQVVMDLNSVKLGWINSNRLPGQAPQKQWNKSLQKYEPAPGPLKRMNEPGWTRGFTVRLAIGGGRAATWEQDAAGAVKGLQNMLLAVPALDALIQRVEAGEVLAELPIMEQQQPEKIDGQTITFAPTWKFVGMMGRPECLKASTVAPVQQAVPPGAFPPFAPSTAVGAVPAGTFNTPAAAPAPVQQYVAPPQPTADANARFGQPAF